MQGLVHPDKLLPLFFELMDQGFLPRAYGRDASGNIAWRVERLPELFAPDFDGVAFAVSSREKGVPTVIESCQEFNDPMNERYRVFGAKSMSEVFSAAEKTKKKLTVVIHDDVYLPKNWSRRVWQQFFGIKGIGIAGLFGVSGNRNLGSRSESGCVIDMRGMRTLGQISAPVKTRVLDGLCLIFRSGERYIPDPRLGFHLYDADVCLQAEERGEGVYSICAPVVHMSEVFAPPQEFLNVEHILRARHFSRLPVETPCALIS